MDVYNHTSWSYVHMLQKGNRCERRGNGGALADSSDFGLLGELSSQKMGNSLSWTPMNRHAKYVYDAARFSVGREIQQPYKHTNSNWYIRTLPINMCR